MRNRLGKQGKKHLGNNLSQLLLKLENIRFRSRLAQISNESCNNINFYGLLIVEDAFTMQFVSFPFIDDEL